MKRKINTLILFCLTLMMFSCKNAFELEIKKDNCYEIGYTRYKVIDKLEYGVVFKRIDFGTLFYYTHKQIDHMKQVDDIEVADCFDFDDYEKE